MEQSLFYIFDLSPKGYIVVPVDIRIRPVLAWSFDSDFLSNSDDSRLKPILISDVKNRINVFSKTSSSLFDYYHRLWETYTGHDNNRLLKEMADLYRYGPWLTTDWNQGYPYNIYCPIDPETGARCPAGCVITAVAMILNYWEYPTSLPITSDLDYVSDATDPVIHIDAASANMDTIIYTNPFGPEPDTDVIARLSWAIGVLLQARYSEPGTATNCTAEDFLMKFRYPSAERWTVSMPGYRNLVRTNMTKGYVAYISFSLPGSGHAAVLDGYDETGAYHMNMGWGGYENGWYYVFDDLPLDFTSINGMILNIIGQVHPDISDNCASSLEIYPGEFEQKKSMQYFSRMMLMV
jgi:hypothetical protein